MKTVQIIILFGLVYCAWADSASGSFSEEEKVKVSGSFPPLDLGFGPFDGFYPRGIPISIPILCPDEGKCHTFCITHGFQGGYCEGEFHKKCHCFAHFYSFPPLPGLI